MTTALAKIENVSELSYADLAALTGQGTADTGTFVPKLNINRDADDEDGNTLPVGQYSIITPEYGRIFSRMEKDKGAIKIQPLFQGYRYGIWNNDEKKYTRQSIIFTDWNKDAPDDQGGNKCGKLTKKQIEASSDAVKEAQSGIKCARLIYGLVNGDFYKIDGTKVPLENYLVLWQLKGTSFMAVQPALDQLAKSKRSMVFHYFTLTKPRREKTGATIYYIPEISFNSADTAVFDEAHFDTLKAVLEVVKKDNDAIMTKYKAAVAKRNGVSDEQVETTVKDITGGSLKDDFDDEIPY